MRRLLVLLALVLATSRAHAADPPERVQLKWVIDALNSRAGKVPAAEITAHFHETFIAKVPPTQLGTIMEQLAHELAPITINEVTSPAPGKLIAKIEGKGQKLRVVLGLDAKTGKMETLLFQPDALSGPRPKTWDEVTAGVPKLGEKASLLVARVDKGRCKALRSVAPKMELAIGSTFKLYVLLALTDQIVAKKLSWDTPVAIQDAWKSLPSGTMQNEAPGKTFKLQEVAAPMIAISDNTATDHVLYTVGRAAAERALKTARHAKPALNVPFLGTRELFLLKLQTPAPDVDAYLKLPAAKRRAWLDGAQGKRALDLTAAVSANSWIAPRRIDTLEWFASGDDLCNVMATLGARGKTQPPVLEILSRNPGLPVDAAAFPYVGYKGGSEPGVINLTWLLKRKDDRWFVVTLGVNDTKKAVGEDLATSFALGVIELLAKEP